MASFDRRRFLQQLSLASVAGLRALRAGAEPSGAAPSPGCACDRTVEQRLAELEVRSGGRLGVAVIDLRGGKRFGYRADERFPMCSTFKLLLAGAVLARVDAGKEQLERRVPYGAADLLEYAPVARARVAEGSLTIEELCGAAVSVSDNTAANLLLVTLGGPSALTAYARSIGDTETRLDRNEPMLNEARPGDPRDTTTPAAMGKTVERLLAGDVLSQSSRERLAAWLVASTTGLARLRAGVPQGWRAGDKTGTGENGTFNDLAVLWPPAEKPIIIAAYLTGTPRPHSVCNAVFADIARLVTT